MGQGGASISLQSRLETSLSCFSDQHLGRDPHAAVQEGRGIYANIIKFVKFQLTTAWGFVLIFLIAGVLGLAGGSPFTALQILWVNLIMDRPPHLPSVWIQPSRTL